MKVLYLDCAMGASGDMLAGALVSLLSLEEQESFISYINAAGIKDVEVSLSDDEKCGVKCRHIAVKISGVEEHTHDVSHHEPAGEHTHNQDEAAGHSHESNLDNNQNICTDSHSDFECNHQKENTNSHVAHKAHIHTTLKDISEIIGSLNISDNAKKDARAIYEIIAAAEGKVHGEEVTMVHFHEVGAMDAVADVTCAAVLMEIIKDNMGVEKVVCSPVNTGFGKVECAHGILPVPAPATDEIIKGMPTYAGKYEGEMLTPTGAAILKYYADEFSDNPIIIELAQGLGSGNKNFEEPNVVRAYIGTI